MSLLKRLLPLGIVAVLSALSGTASALPACTFGHCTQLDSAVKRICANKYRMPIEQMNNNHTIDVYDNSGAQCTCPCSCVAAETLVQLFQGEEILARTVRKDDVLLLPQAERADGTVFGAMGAKVERSEAQQVYFENDRLLTVSPNHTFVTPEGKIVTAEKVRQGQLVLDGANKPITVLQSRRLKNYTGSLFNVIVNEASSVPKDQVVVTNGVQSGDWLLQSTQDTMRQEIDLRLGRVQTFNELVN